MTLLAYRKSLLQPRWLVALIFLFPFTDTLAMPSASSPQSGVRQAVPGTWCSLEVPDGFTVAARFKGFEQAVSGSSILISLVGSPYAASVKSLKSEKFNAEGSELLESNPVVLNGNQAMYYRFNHRRKDVAFLKQMLLLGDDGRTVSVSAFCPASDSALAMALKASLLSVEYDPKDEGNLLAGVPFTIDAKGVGFKPVSLKGNTLVFTADGQFPTKRDDRAIFLAGTFTFPDTVGDRLLFAQNKIRGLNGIDSSAVYQSQPTTIDSLVGYTLQASGKYADGTPQQVHAVVLMAPRDQFFLLVGVASGKAKKYAAVFPKIYASFRRR